MQDLQYRQMAWLGFDDIRSNFLIGGDGAVYVGRGWNIEGDHTPKYNVKSICITFIGSFNKKAPSQKQLDAAQQLIELGVKQGKLRPSYNLYGQYQLDPLENSSKVLYEIIREWDHWTEIIE